MSPLVWGIPASTMTLGCSEEAGIPCTGFTCPTHVCSLLSSPPSSLCSFCGTSQPAHPAVTWEMLMQDLAQPDVSEAPNPI